MCKRGKARTQDTREARHERLASLAGPRPDTTEPGDAVNCSGCGYRALAAHMHWQDGRPLCGACADDERT